MKKPVIWIALFLLMLSVCACGKEKNPVVKSVTQKEYDSNGDIYFKTIYEYNELGLPVYELMEDGLGVFYEGEYEWEAEDGIYIGVLESGKARDDDGNLVEASIRCFEVEFDKDGDIISFKEYSSDDSLLWKEESVWEDGICVERTTENYRAGSEKKESETIQEFDEYGNLIKIKSKQYGEIDVNQVNEYEYDKHGRIEEWICKDKYADEKYEVEVEYDKDGNLVEEVREMGDDIFVTEYKYDKNGNKTEVKIYSNDVLQTKQEYEYYD